MANIELWLNGNFYKEITISQQLLTYGNYREHILVNNEVYMHSEFWKMDLSREMEYQTVVFHREYDRLVCNDPTIKIGRAGLYREDKNILKIKEDFEKEYINNNIESRFDILDL